jgi:acyl-CoA thioesterase
LKIFKSAKINNFTLMPMQRRCSVYLLSRKSFDSRSYFTTPNFDLDTTAQQINDNDFQIKLSRNYSIGDAPNGGYLGAIAVSAARTKLPFKNPLTLSCHFLMKALEDKIATINIQVINIAKSSATALITISQDEKSRCVFLGTFGLFKDSGFTQIDGIAPSLPPRDECIDANKIIKKTAGDNLRISCTRDFLVPPNGEFANTVLSQRVDGTAKYECWLRHSNDRKICDNSMTFFNDCLPPPVLNIKSASWVPTIEYTVHYWRPIPLSNNLSKGQTDDENDVWVRARFSSQHIENGMLHTDGEIWSADGSTLLSKSRQLGKILSGGNNSSVFISKS